MNKETNKLIPEIRFPEFMNVGEWKDKKISDLGETINGLTGKSGEDFGNGKPYVTYKQVFDNSSIDFEKCGKVQIGENENQNSLQRGDILVTTSSETPNEVGFASVLVDSPKEDIYLNSFCFSLRPFSLKEIQPEFSQYLFHSPIYRKSVTTLAQGSTRYNISKVAFINLKLPIPLPNEQQKIAACLSSLDEVIAAHSQKLDLLKDHKKGLMQNLFPQEGEKVPKFRFKEFVGDGEWKEKPLGSLSNLISEKAGTKKYKLLSVTAGVGFVSQIEKFGREIAGDSYKNYFVIRKGDFAYNKSSVKIHPEGQIAFLENDDFGAVPNSIFTCFRVDKNILLPAFLKYPFENNIHGKWLRKFIAVGARANGALNVDNKDLLALPITFPSIAEQQKIASGLSTLDNLIKAQTEKVEQLKLHKKGLMQGLFPKINE